MCGRFEPGSTIVVLVEEDRARNMGGLEFGRRHPLLRRQIPGGVDDGEARPAEGRGEFLRCDQERVLAHAFVFFLSAGPSGPNMRWQEAGQAGVPQRRA